MKTSFAHPKGKDMGGGGGRGEGGVKIEIMKSQLQV